MDGIQAPSMAADHTPFRPQEGAFRAVPPSAGSENQENGDEKRRHAPTDDEPPNNNKKQTKESNANEEKTVTNISKLLSMSLVQTYRKVNPKFAYHDARNPRRPLTQPSDGVANGGLDNKNADLILRVNDQLMNVGGKVYVVKDILGHGTFGQVARCVEEDSGEDVAVKVIKNETAYYNQALVEINILESLNNQYDSEDKYHIVRIRDSFTFNKHLCIVFEKLSVNLYDLIKRNSFKGLSTSLVKVFTAQLLKALTVTAEADIIHCDLKPENVLLKNLQSPSLKLIDFGSACNSNQTVYTYIQSRFYRSIEVILGLPYSTKIDVWSLGCICSELFLGLPLLPGVSEYNQLCCIVDMFGPPPDYMLAKGKSTLKYYKHLPEPSKGSHYRLKTAEEFHAESGGPRVEPKKYFRYSKFEDIIQYYSYKKGMSKEDIAREKQQRSVMIDFIRGLLQYDPLKRWSPQQASRHPFITGEPLTEMPFKPPPNEEIPRLTPKRSHPQGIRHHRYHHDHDGFAHSPSPNSHSHSSHNRHGQHGHARPYRHNPHIYTTRPHGVAHRHQHMLYGGGYSPNGSYVDYPVYGTSPYQHQHAMSSYPPPSNNTSNNAMAAGSAGNGHVAFAAMVRASAAGYGSNGMITSSPDEDADSDYAYVNGTGMNGGGGVGVGHLGMTPGEGHGFPGQPAGGSGGGAAAGGGNRRPIIGHSPSHHFNNGVFGVGAYSRSDGLTVDTGQGSAGRQGQYNAQIQSRFAISPQQHAALAMSQDRFSSLPHPHSPSATGSHESSKANSNSNNGNVNSKGSGSGSGPKQGGSDGGGKDEHTTGVGGGHKRRTPPPAGPSKAALGVISSGLVVNASYDQPSPNRKTPTTPSPTSTSSSPLSSYQKHQSREGVGGPQQQHSPTLVVSGAGGGAFQNNGLYTLQHNNSSNGGMPVPMSSPDSTEASWDPFYDDGDGDELNNSHSENIVLPTSADGNGGGAKTGSAAIPVPMTKARAMTFGGDEVYGGEMDGYGGDTYAGEVMSAGAMGFSPPNMHYDGFNSPGMNGVQQHHHHHQPQQQAHDQHPAGSWGSLRQPVSGSYTSSAFPIYGFSPVFHHMPPNQPGGGHPQPQQPLPSAHRGSDYSGHQHGFG